jgi:hypothetical protein
MSWQSADHKQPEPLDLPEIKVYTHRAHSFPGKFHPPLISHLLEKYDDHNVVADPMCGCGTTGVEAVVNGMDAILNDIDPLSALISRGKTNPVEPDSFLEVRDEILESLGELPEEGELDQEEAEAIVEENIDGKPYVKPYNLFHWFEPYVAAGYSELLDIAYSAMADESGEMQDALHLSLAAMVRQISRADPEPVSGLEVTKIRKKQLEEGVDFDVRSSFKSVSNRLAEGYEDLMDVNDLGDVQVWDENAKHLSDPISDSDLDPSLVITSPPYCNAIEYSRRHRLEYEWLGLFNDEDVSDPRDERIESSREFFGSVTPTQQMLKNLDEVPHPEIRDLTDDIESDGHERKANLLRKYFLDSYDWVREIREILPEGGIFCLIIGPSTSYGRKVDTPNFLKDIAEENEFEVIDRHDYLLKNNKMQYPTNGETTETESLIEFRAV